MPRWQSAKPSPRAMWVLPVPLLPTAMTFSRSWMYSHRASSITSALFSDRMAGKSKVSMLLTAGKRAAQIRQPQQVLGVVHTLGRTGLPSSRIP